MALEIDRNNWFLKKCGEISTFLPVGKKDFFLNCGFCEFSFHELNNFIEHITEDHSLEFLDVESRQDVEDIPLDLQESNETISFSEVEDTDVDGHVLKGFEIVEILETDKSDIPLEDSPCHSIKDEPITDYLETDFLPELDQRTEHTHSKEINSCKKQDTNYEALGDHGMKNEAAKCDSEVNALHEKKSKWKLSYNTCPRKCSILDDAQCISLARIYKLHTCLWNEENIAYRFKNKRQEALREVLNEFNTKTGLNLSQQDLEKEVVMLRKIAANEKKLKIACKKTNSIHKTTCPFYDHISFLEVDVAPFECSKCGKLHPGLGQLKVHFAEHDGSLPFKCNICGHGFQLGNNLTVHLRRHAQDYRYNCELCNKSCVTTTEMKIHMRSHTGEKPFVCSICGERAVTSSHLLLHMRVSHEKLRRYKCKLCPKMFYESGTLNDHMAVHKNVRDHICRVCNKGFKNGKQLGQHQLIHNAEKRYSCKFCGKRFAQSSGLCGHMKAHGTKLSATFPERVT